MFSITGARHASKTNQAIPARYAPASKISGDGAADQASNSRNKGVIDRMWRPLTPVETLKCKSIQREFKGYHIWKRSLMQRLDLLSSMNLTPTPQSSVPPSVIMRLPWEALGEKQRRGKFGRVAELAALIGPGVEFESYLRKNPETLGFDRPLIRAVHCFQALLNHVDR